MDYEQLRRFAIEADKRGDREAAMAAMRKMQEMKPAAVGQTGSIADPLAQGATLGFADEIAGIVGAIPASFQTGNSIADSYRGIRDAARQQRTDFAERNPKTALAAELGGGLLTGGIGTKYVAGAKGADLVRKSAMLGGLLGGTSGAGYSTEDSVTGVLGDAAQGAAIGGAVGAAFPAAGQALAKAKRAAQTAAAPSQNYTQAVDVLKRNGVPVTGGQVRGSNWQKVVEEQLGDTPIIGTPLQRVREDQRTAFQKGLLRILKVDEGDGLIDLNRAKSIMDDLSAEYGKALKGKFINIADDSFIDDLARIEAKHTEIIDDASAGKIRSIVNNFLKRATEDNGQKTGEWYQRQRSLFAKRAQGTSDSAGLYGDLVEALDDAFERAAPAVKGDLDKRWSQARQLYRVAQSGGAEVSEGILPLASLNRLAKTKPSTDVWREYVNSGATVLPARSGNSGTATRQMANDFVRGGILTVLGINNPQAIIPMLAARGVANRLARGTPLDVTRLMPGGLLLQNPALVAPTASTGLLVAD